MRGSCGTRPLQQNYITPHCPQCPPVDALKLRLVPVTASRPSGEGNRRYAKLPSLDTVAQPSTLPGRCPLSSALRAASWLPCGCRGAVALVRRFAQCFWSVACGQPCCVGPAHPCGPRRCAALALRWSARPPPRGSLSPAQRSGIQAIRSRVARESIGSQKTRGPCGATKTKARNKSGLCYQLSKHSAFMFALWVKTWVGSGKPL